jgi:hypothetical protein
MGNETQETMQDLLDALDLELPKFSRIIVHLSLKGRHPRKDRSEQRPKSFPRLFGNSAHQNP